MERKSWYSSIFCENSAVTLLIHPETGKIMDVNPAAIQYYGYSHEEFVTMNITEIQVSDHHDLKEELIRSLTSKTGRFQNEHRLSDGTIRKIEAYTGSIDVHGKTLTYVIVHDITDRLVLHPLLQERRKELEAIFRCSVILDHKDIPLSIVMNHLLDLIADGFQYPEETVVRLTIYNREAKHDKFIMTQWLLEGELRMQGKLVGALQVCHLSGKTKLDEGSFFSEKKNMIKEIAHRINGYLERMELISKIAQEKEKAESCNRLKAAFLRNVSHEVRTPLNGILGFASLLTEDAIPEEERSEYLCMLNRSANRLLDTITDYLVSSQLTCGSLIPAPEPLLIMEEIEKVKDYFQPLFAEKHIIFSVVIAGKLAGVTIETDRDLFRKALHHILKNALKFSKEGCVTMKISVSCHSLWITVTDNGIGISEEAKSRVFALFEQEEMTMSRKFEGNGLGLFILKGITELLGGSVTLNSEKGKGTTVVMELPLQGRRTLNSAEVGDNRQKERKGCILVVDDDPANRFLMKKIIEPHYSGIKEASDGRQAVDICQNNPDITLVLMDLKMPIMDGFFATREIRKRNAAVKIIAVSALSSPDDINLAMEAGCCGFVPKPARKKAIIKSINELAS